MHVYIQNTLKYPTQSGKAKAQHWVLTFGLASPQEPDPLMGWPSTSDTQKQVRLSFSSLPEAILYAQNQGYTYEIIAHSQEPHFKPKNYSSNFL